MTFTIVLRLLMRRYHVAVLRVAFWRERIRHAPRDRCSNLQLVQSSAFRKCRRKTFPDMSLLQDYCNTMLWTGSVLMVDFFYWWGELATKAKSSCMAGAGPPVRLSRLRKLYGCLATFRGLLSVLTLSSRLRWARLALWMVFAFFFLKCIHSLTPLHRTKHIVVDDDHCGIYWGEHVNSEMLLFWVDPV